MRFHAKGAIKRHLELFSEQDISLGKIDYPSWFTLQATIATGNATYEVTPTGFWRNTIVISQNDIELGRIIRQWNGQMTLTIGNGPAYVFKRVGFFNGHYGLFNEQDRELVVIEKQSQFSFFNTRYDIETDDNYPEINNALFLLLLIHGVSYFNQAHAVV